MHLPCWTPHPPLIWSSKVPSWTTMIWFPAKTKRKCASSSLCWTRGCSAIIAWTNILCACSNTRWWADTCVAILLPSWPRFATGGGEFVTWAWRAGRGTESILANNMSAVRFCCSGAPKFSYRNIGACWVCTSIVFEWEDTGSIRCWTSFCDAWRCRRGSGVSFTRGKPSSGITVSPPRENISWKELLISLTNLFVITFPIWSTMVAHQGVGELV